MSDIYVVSTPIGNLEDITLRALNILKKVNYIFCEDTNHSKILLSKYELKNKKLYSLNKFNESSREKLIIDILSNDEDIAIISDAGTPTISDPGQFILKKLREKNFNLIPIPGVNSIITSLSVSGEIYNSFSFFGFFPKSKEKMKSMIFENIQTDISIYFEAANRIKQTLEFFRDELGDIPIILAKELTKKFEKIIKEKPSIILNELNLKGEFVFLINKKDIKKELQIKYIFAKYSNLFSSKTDLINHLISKYQFKKSDLNVIIKVG